MEFFLFLGIYRSVLYTTAVQRTPLCLPWQKIALKDTVWDPLSVQGDGALGRLNENSTF